MIPLLSDDRERGKPRITLKKAAIKSGILPSNFR
jgi:hypothetical protein